MADFCGKPDSGGLVWLTNHARGSFGLGGGDRLLETVLVAQFSWGESLGMPLRALLDADGHLWRTGWHPKRLYAVVQSVNGGSGTSTGPSARGGKNG